jgi:hypothetical protein
MNEGMLSCWTASFVVETGDVAAIGAFASVEFQRLWKSFEILITFRVWYSEKFKVCSVLLRSSSLWGLRNTRPTGKTFEVNHLVVGVLQMIVARLGIFESLRCTTQHSNCTSEVRLCGSYSTLQMFWTLFVVSMIYFFNHWSTKKKIGSWLGCFLFPLS